MCDTTARAGSAAPLVCAAFPSLDDGSRLKGRD
jgi:hypothetical protein